MTQQMNIEGQMEEVVETVESQEKAPRKKKDVSGALMRYVAENPYNGTLVEKNFRESEPPVGVIFCKLIREKAPPVCLARVCEDGSIEGPWSCDEKRLISLGKWIASGKQPFYDKDSVRVQTNILCAGEVLAKESKPRVAKEKAPKKERTPRVKAEGTVTKPRPSAFKGLLPEDELETDLTFESYDEDGSTSLETRAFSSKKRALDHARSLGLSNEDAEKSVTKVDGDWTVVQN